MVAKGNKDGHRYTYSSGVKAVESEKWGREAARSRYPGLKYQDGAPMPKDTHGPQAPEYKQAPGYRNEVPVSSWLRGGGESGKPRRK